MQINTSQNKVGALTAAAIVWFTTPFGASTGTAGCLTLHRFNSTGNSVYATPQLQTAIEMHSERLNTLMANYGLEKQQLAKLLAVGRPTLDSWLQHKVDTIRPANQERLELLEKLLNQHISTDLKLNFGHFLKRKLDDNSRTLLSALSPKNLNESSVEDLLKSTNRRLAGLKKAAKLDRLLGENRPAFI